jgi:hypothetical protein
MMFLKVLLYNGYKMCKLGVVVYLIVGYALSPEIEPAARRTSTRLRRQINITKAGSISTC